MPAKKQPKRSASPEQKPAPARSDDFSKESVITHLVKNLSDWLDVDAHQVALSDAINAAIKEYSDIRHHRQYPLGEPVSSEPPTPSDPHDPRFPDEAAERVIQLRQREEDSLVPWVVKETAEFTKRVVNSMRFAYATVANQTLSDSALELQQKFGTVNHENAKNIFLSLDELKGGWDTDNHVQGTLGIGAASLKTRIVAKVIDAMLVDLKAPPEEHDAFDLVDYPGECLTTSQRQAHAVYNQLIGYRAAKLQHSETATVATTMSPPGS